MSHRFPKKRPISGNIIDIEPINEAIRPFAEEQGGKLNEHNWALNAVTDATKVEAGAITRIHSAHVEVNPPVGQASGFPATTPANGWQVPNSGEWNTIANLTADKDFSESIVHAIFSFQIGTSIPAGANLLYGISFGVFIDERLISESVPGSFDKTLDQLSEGLWETNIYSPVVIETIEPIIAGFHSVQLKARVHRDLSLTPPAADAYFYICNREIILLELY